MLGICSMLGKLICRTKLGNFAQSWAEIEKVKIIDPPEKVGLVTLGRDPAQGPGSRTRAQDPDQQSYKNCETFFEF